MQSNIENIISAKEFLKKYKIITYKMLYNSTYVFKEIKNFCTKGKRIYYDEKELITLYNLKNYTESFITISEASYRFSVSKESILKYISEKDIIKLKTKIYVNSECIESIKNIVSLNYHKKLSVSELNSKFDSIMGNEYVRQEDILKRNSKILVLHKLCGNITEMNVDNCMSKKTGCSICYGKRKYTTEELRNKIINKYFGEYVLVDDSEYISNKKGYVSIMHACSSCNFNVFKTKLNYFLSGDKKCPICNTSIPIQIACNILENNNIEYELEKRVDYLDHKFRYDIFIKSINTFIEYDGEQHFNSIDYFNKKQNHLERVEYDLLKNDFIDKSKYKLVRISYLYKNKIAEIINKIINGEELRDYPNSEYNQVIGNNKYINVILI